MILPPSLFWISDMSAIRPSRVTPVPLTALFEGIDGDDRVTITDIRVDSRDIGPDCLYAALPGRHTHGATFAGAAVQAGAVAILTDTHGATLLGELPVPVVISSQLRHDLALAAAHVFGYPARSLQSFGVTGTNGKTTTVALLEAALMSAGARVGTIGTIGFRLDSVAIPSSRSTVTTPEAPDLQALLAVMVERGADAMALEVSSHALAMKRIDGMQLEVAAFLNLGRDHLDFHANQTEYFEAKASLFSPEHCRRAVVWIDDQAGHQIAQRSTVPVTTVGEHREADYRLRHYAPIAPLGGRAIVERHGQQLELSISLPGKHNMIDAAVALAMLEAVEIPTATIIEGLQRAQVPGRMESVPLGDNAPVVIVDFAHTPQAVAATLDALQVFEHVITVVGCGGDRDVDKRAEMGKAAAMRSDLVIVTDDNPRTEDPRAIRASVLDGARSVSSPTGRAAVVRDIGGRAEAILEALRQSRPTSVVAILGKGHETGQEINGQIMPFEDAVEAHRAWAVCKEDARA